MSQINKTLAFVMCAVCSIGAAALTHYSFKPATPVEAADVGEPFYPEFTEPSKATALRVASHNEKTSRTDVFAVEFKDGRWRIPSHHNYPADGKDRLARTAASMLGIRRGQLVSSSPDALKNFGLLDPLDKNISGTDGRGNRVTLSEGDTVLADYIIGRKEGDGNQYYIRRADEPRVYLAEVNIDLSTKFVDWIQPNLLDATSTNFRELELDRYEVDEAKGVIVPGDISRLSRKSSTDEWHLDGIDGSKFKVKTSVVNAMTTALADLKIVGVRPKPAGLKAALKGEKGQGPNPLEEADMQQKGYFLTRDGGLYSNEGEFLAGTSEGVSYRLRFGEVFTGSEMDIEIGSTAKPEDATDKAADASQGDSEKDKPDEARKENRYVFITADFDAKLLGAAPVEPVKPTPPDGYTPTKQAAATVTPKLDEPPAATPDAKSEEKPAATTPEPSTSAVSRDAETLSLAGPPSDPPSGEAAPAATETPAADVPATDAPTQTPAEEPAAPPAAETPANPPATDKPAQAPAAAAKDPNAEYEAALKAYEQALDEYRVQKQDYDAQVKKGQERAKQLSDRFADWYYVISADLYKDLKVSPDQLIEPKEPAKSPSGDDATKPPVSLDAAGAEDASAAATPAPEGSESPAVPAVEDKPAETPPPIEEPQSEKPPAEPAQPETPPAGEAPPPQS